VSSSIQVLGREFEYTFSPEAIYRLNFLDDTHVDVTVVADAGYPAGTLNHFETQMTEIRPDVHLITWIEPATGNTVTHVDDFAGNISYTNITDLASGAFWRMTGTITPLS
jgi:hypothetical protein